MHWCALHIEWSITKAWFLKSMIGCLENSGLLSHTDIQSGDTFHFTMSPKFTCSNYHHIKSIKVWEASKLTVADTHFQKFCLIEAWIFSLAANSASCFPWSNSLPFSFSRKYLLDIEIWITVVHKAFFQVKMLFHESCRSACNSDSPANIFPWHSSHTSVYNSCFVIQNVKTILLRCWNLM